MNLNDLLEQLEKLGTAQNRKVYSRHGIGEKMYGVSFANLKKLAKSIKNDNTIAEELWQTGNHDARVLATLCSNPKTITETTVDHWVDDLDNYVITDSFSGLVSKTPFLQQKMEEWVTSDDEWKATAGWNLMAHLAMNAKDLPDDYFEKYLDIIEKDIHESKNRVRYSMNSALIAIGIRNGDLKEQATARAKRIGTVHVDHGETGCKTPDAVPYMEKAFKRKKK